MSSHTVEQVTEPVAFHGEGPVWSPSWGGLRWVDMLAGDLLTLRHDGGVDRLHVGEVAAFVRPRAGGGYVVGLERGLGMADCVDDEPVPLAPMWDNPGVRMNEGGCDTAGNLYAGTMAYDRSPGSATLYRVTPELQVSVVLDAVTISNGVDVTPDGTRAYYNDTETGRTDLLDVDAHGMSRRRPFWTAHAGRPDGLTVDSAGNVWTALNQAGRVVCLSPTAEVLAEVELPVRGTTACTLGGADLRDLYVSTSREGLEDPEPDAGAVFRTRVEVPGKPVLPFAG